MTKKCDFCVIKKTLFVEINQEAFEKMMQDWSTDQMIDEVFASESNHLSANQPVVTYPKGVPSRQEITFFR